MKKLYMFSALFIVTISTFAQIPNISMTTTLSVNSQITIGLKGNTASTPIQIDWGNGIKENFTIGTDIEFFGYPVKGSTLKIWGPGITGLTIQSKNITALEFSGATLLESLFCKNNQITTLNLTGCSALEFVECNQNLISNLLLPSTTTLTYIDCSNNNLTLASLPLKQSSWTNYIYTPQKAYKLAKKEYSVNEEIDLSSQQTINSITTTYVWKTKGGTALVNGTDYNVTNGKFSFIKGNADSLYCEMTNSSLPGLTLNTSCIAIPSPPAIVMTIENATSVWIGVGANVDAIIKADWGDGNLESMELKNYNRYYFSRSILGKTIKLYGDKLSYLQINSAGLTAINVSNAPNLSSLECAVNKLTTLDVSNNIELRELDCSKNQLTSIDVSHNSNLYKLNCSNNYLAYNNIPTKKPSWTSYIFSPQLFNLSKNLYYTNEAIDVSNQYSINGNTSVYKWKTLSGATLTKGIDYTESNGIFTVLVAQADLLVCEVTNATFPELTLKTEAITVLSSEPSIIATINNQAISTLYFRIGASANATIQVDWGNGTLTSHNVSSTISNINGAIKGSIVKIYGAGINYLSLSYCLLTAIDVSKAILLNELNCYGNNLTSIDVSKNSALTQLSCHSNSLTTLDVSKNTALSELDCSSNRLTTLDVSNNNALTRLHCDSNRLTALDVSNNTALFLLYCSSNRLTTLDLSKNTALRYLYCNLNRFNFHTLPVKQPAWMTYTYSPQGAIALPKKNYAINEEIDLNSHLTVNGNTTSYTWKTKGGKTLVNGTDYSENNGKFNFLKPSIDSIYCEMKNSTFPDLTLKTTALALPLPQDPNILINTTNSVGSIFSFIIRSVGDNTTAYVNWGDGNLIPYNVNTTNSIISGTLKSNTIKVFGEEVVYIDISSKKVTTIDISNCISLKYFFCNGNQLANLNISKNTALIRLNSSYNQISEIDVTKNTALIYLDCYNNMLTSLDVSKNTSLTELNCSYNKLTSIDVTNNVALTNLDCDNNQFASLDVTKNIALTRLDCGRTTLSDLDITKNLMLKELYCAANNIAQLDVSKNTSLSIVNCYENKLSSLALSNISTITEVKCYSNKLTFNSLPIKKSSWTVYTYSPQAAITLQKKNYTLSEVIDLSSHLTINGKTTNYIWKTKGGITLISGIDYSLTDGTTTFLRTQNDSVYCQMTNTTFTGLTLSTTNIKVTQFPTSIDETNLTINIYPNPIKETLNIEMNENILKVEVYNVVGLKIYEKQSDLTLNMTIPAENLPKGLLIVKVYGRNWVMKRNVIKE